MNDGSMSVGSFSLSLTGPLTPMVRLVVFSWLSISSWIWDGSMSVILSAPSWAGLVGRGDGGFDGLAGTFLFY